MFGSYGTGPRLREWRGGGTVVLALLFSLVFAPEKAFAYCPPTRELWSQVVRQARAFGLDPLLVYAVIWRESRFCPNAVGKKGEVGLGQVMPSTAAYVGVPPAYLFHPEWNLNATSRYLRYLYTRYGDWRKALMAYNAGPKRVDEGRVPASAQIYAQGVLRDYAWLKQRFQGNR